MVHKAFLLKDIPLFSKEGLGEICPIPDIFNDKKHPRQRLHLVVSRVKENFNS